MGSAISSVVNVGASIAGNTLGALSDSLDLTGSRARGNALNAQREAYGDVQGYYRPYQQLGQQALSNLTSGNFEMDPSYQFRMQEGLKALQNAAGARGGRQSGATLKALTGYGQNLASQEYGNAFNRNLSLANLGFGASQGMSGARTGIANATASNEMAGHSAKMGLLGQGLSLATLGLSGGLSGLGSAPVSNSAGFSALPQSPVSNYGMTGIQPYKLNTYGY